MEKMTKKEYFAKIKELLANESEIVAFCDRELALLAKKNGSRSDAPSKTQIENQALSNEILDIMSTLDEAKTVTELINETEIGKLTFGKENKAMTNQKLSRLVNDLAKANKVVRTETKGVAYFKAI